MKVENDLGSDNIRGLVLRLALPSMLAQFVSVFYSIVDRMYIGNIREIGEIALAGVGICGPIVNLIASFALLIGIGGSPLVSIRLGQKNQREAEKIIANCFAMLLFLSLFMTVIALVFKRRLLMWFGASEITYPYANQYLTIYLLGTIFALMTTGMNQFIICQGFAKTGMKSVLIGAVANIILDPLFIFGFGFQVRGAAIATVLSQMLSCIYVLCFLFGKKVPIRITFQGYARAIMKRVLIVGMTPFIIVAFDNIIIIAMNAVIQRYGGDVQGARLLTCTTIVQSFMLMITMPLGGITGGTQTILGYNYGARRPDKVMRAEREILRLGFVFTAIMFCAAHFIPQYFVRIFTQKEEYIALTVRAIRIYTLGVIPLSLQYTVVDGLTGMGITRYAITLSMLRKTIFLACVYLLPKFMDITNIFYAEPAADIVGAAITGITFLAVIPDMLAKLAEPQTLQKRK